MLFYQFHKCNTLSLQNYEWDFKAVLKGFQLITINLILTAKPSTSFMNGKVSFKKLKIKWKITPQKFQCKLNGSKVSKSEKKSTKLSLKHSHEHSILFSTFSKKARRQKKFSNKNFQSEIKNKKCARTRYSSTWMHEILCCCFYIYIPLQLVDDIWYDFALVGSKKKILRK